MEKKVRFSNKTLMAKIIYAAVIAILCIAAIVIGIVSAANRPSTDVPSDDNPPADIGGETPDDSGNEQKPPVEDKKEQTFISPIVGTVVKEHSLEVPVYSITLGEWRMHTGIDISAETGAPVYASCDGTVSRIYTDAMHGYTVELSHKDGVVTRYSNLTKEDASMITVGDEVKSGDRIGTVGDTSISELAEEPHLHFEVLLNDVKVNPLDYISEESKEASLGITAE